MVCEVCGNEVFRRVQTPRRGRTSDARLVECADCGARAWEVSRHESYVVGEDAVEIAVFRSVYLPRLQDEYLKRKMQRMGRGGNGN